MFDELKFEAYLSLNDRGSHVFKDDRALGKDGDLAGHLLLVPRLDRELDIITQLRCPGLLLHFGEVKIDLPNNVGPLDVARVLLDGINHALVLNRSGGVLQAGIKNKEKK